MIGSVMTSIWKGCWWCGNVCPRGNSRLHQVRQMHIGLPDENYDIETLKQYHVTS